MKPIFDRDSPYCCWFDPFDWSELQDCPWTSSPYWIILSVLGSLLHVMEFFIKWAISETPGSWKGHPQIWRSHPLAHDCAKMMYGKLGGYRLKEHYVRAQLWHNFPNGYHCLERSHPLPHMFISRNQYPSLTCLVLLEFLLLKYVGNKLNRPARLDPITDPITSITIG